MEDYREEKRQAKASEVELEHRRFMQNPRALGRASLPLRNAITGLPKALNIEQAAPPADRSEAAPAEPPIPTYPEDMRDDLLERAKETAQEHKEQED